MYAASARNLPGVARIGLARFNAPRPAGRRVGDTSGLGAPHATDRPVSEFEGPPLVEVFRHFDRHLRGGSAREEYSPRHGGGAGGPRHADGAGGSNVGAPHRTTGGTGGQDGGRASGQRPGGSSRAGGSRAGDTRRSEVAGGDGGYVPGAGIYDTPRAHVDPPPTRRFTVPARTVVHSTRDRLAWGIALSEGQ